jgi:hypothetical protein
MHPLKRSFIDGQSQPRFATGPNYPSKVKSLKEAISAILPDAQFLPEYLYRTTTDGTALNGGVPKVPIASGRGLFEFDPDNGSGTPELRILFENGGEKKAGIRPGGPWHFQVVNGALVDA